MNTPFQREIELLVALLPNAEGWGDIVTVCDVIDYQKSREQDITELTKWHESNIVELRELSGIALLETDKYPSGRVPSAVLLKNALDRGQKIMARTYQFEIDAIDAWLLKFGLRSSY